MMMFSSSTTLSLEIDLFSCKISCLFERLLTVSSEVYNSPSVAKLLLLYNNYILESKENEIYTAQEKLEENDLLDTILATPVMQHTRNFLIRKGKSYIIQSSLFEVYYLRKIGQGSKRIQRLTEVDLVSNVFKRRWSYWI